MAGTLSAQMKSTQRQLAGAQKCSIQALPTQEPPSLQKVAYQECVSLTLFPDKVHGLGELGQLMSIFCCFKYDSPASMQPIAIHADRAITPFEEIPDAIIVIQ